MAEAGYDIVEHRIKQITNSFTESRHLLAEIEDSLHASNQLRRGESDKISEVDSEFLRCSSSIQGGWERITRFKGKALISTDDPVLFILEKTFDSVENSIYRVLADAHTNEGFLDYGTLIVTCQQETKPLLDALKDLAHRLRSVIGLKTQSEASSPASDRPGSRSQSRTRALRTIRDPNAALGSSRYDQSVPLTTSYNPQARKGSSLASSSYGGSNYDSDSYKGDLDQTENPRFRELDSSSITSRGSNSRSVQSSWSNLSDFDSGSKHRPPPLFSSKTRNQSETSQPRVVSSIQEELPDLNIGSLRLSPDQLYPATFDSRNNSTSDDGAHHSHIYGSSRKSSSIATPDTLPSPISPGPPPYNHDEVVYRSNVGKIRETPSRQLPRENRTQRNQKHESIEAVSPHSQSRKKYPKQQMDSYGPPPAPPPMGRLPEPPRPVKMSLFPTAARRDLNRDIGSAASDPSSRSGELGTDMRSPIPIGPLRPSSRQQGGHNGTPPDRGFSLQNNFGTHGLKYTPPPSSLPPNRAIDRSVLDARSNTEPFLRPVQQNSMLPPLPPAKEPAGTKPIEIRFLADEETLSDQPPVKHISPSEETSMATLLDPAVVAASRPSLAQTTSSEGTIRQEKWRCLTQTVKQIAGLPGPPIELVPSSSSSTRPADNLPCEANKYWTLCKNAVVMQTGEGKKSAEEVANRPTGITGNEKYMKCRKCKYEYSAFSKTAGLKGATTDPRWKEGPGGLLYKETILFKSHVTSKKDKLPQEEYHFGCIFCAAGGNGMPIYKGKTSFLTHLAEHGNGVHPNEVLKTRIKFTTRREYKPDAQDTYFELVLP